MQNVFTKEAGMTNYQIKDLKYHAISGPVAAAAAAQTVGGAGRA